MEIEKAARHDLITTINYYNDPGDGGAPMPVYVGKYGDPFLMSYHTLFSVLSTIGKRGSSLRSSVEKAHTR